MRVKTNAKQSDGARGGVFWPVAYRWAAAGTLMAYTAIGVSRVTPAWAMQQGSTAAPQVRERVIHQPVRFNIPPGTLEAVLDGFRSATGLQVQVVDAGIGTLDSPGVAGLYTDEQALQRLLAGTGAGYRFMARDTVRIELRGPSTSIEVSDQVAPLSSPKYTEPLRDTPQSITVIPRTVMEEQGATTLRDVLRNIPGLTVAAGEGGAPAGDNLTLRGFSARNDLFVDGARDLGPQSRDPFNVEQVEVTKGPTSAFSGRGSAGGTINMMSKAPSLQRYFGGTINLGSDGTRRGTADVNLPLGRLGLGERNAFRLNLLGHHSGVAGRDVVENNRWGAAPSLALGLGTPTRLRFSYYKLKQDNIPDYGIPWVPAANNALAAYRDRPAPVPRETFYGLRNRDFERMGADMATVNVEHDFSDEINLRSQLRYGRSTRDSLTTPPRFLNNDSTAINREARSWITRDGVWDNQTDLTARFSTGGIRHSLVTGLALTRENNLRKTRTTVGTSVTNLLNPNPDDPFEGVNTIGPDAGDVTGSTQSVYAFDTVKLGQRWEATGGLRWERFDVDGVNTSLASVSRVDTMKSVRAGLVYKPAANGSVYASYGTSLSPSLEGLTYGTANNSIEPEKTYTVEVGSKWDLAQDRLMLSGAIFRVDKDNARTPGLLPDDPPQVLQGRQRVNGFEITATGGITRYWKVLGAYTFLDGKILRSNTPAEVGRTLLNTPRHSFSIWTTCQLRKLMVGVGPRFAGARYGNNTNARRVDRYWTLDALASYPVTSRLDLRLNLFNLNNAYYFDRIGGGHLIPGAARSVNGSIAIRF